ncbi:MAG: hypothetical protein M0024_06745 [Nitrospiraceae bacterium]|nr:hypothetical protein [Nitrospiraceae bacterium]
MAEAWHEGLPDDAFMSEADRVYMAEINRVREGLASGLAFEEAAALIQEQDEGVKAAIKDDVLKILIAEEHFAKGVPLDELALRLALPGAILETAKKSMLEEVVGDGSMRDYLQGLDNDEPGRVDA